MIAHALKILCTKHQVSAKGHRAIRLHVVTGHDLIGCRDEAIEPLLVPYKVRALHGAGIAVVLKRTGFPSDDIVEVRTQAIVAFLGRVAGPTRVVECQLPRLGVGALTRRFLGHGREPQKHQEYGADQSRDCGAGHRASSRFERAVATIRSSDLERSQSQLLATPILPHVPAWSNTSKTQKIG